MATAVQFEHTGAPDVLTLKAVSQAAPGPDEVWLEQEAIGVIMRFTTSGSSDVAAMRIG